MTNVSEIHTRTKPPSMGMKSVTSRVDPRFRRFRPSLRGLSCCNDGWLGCRGVHRLVSLSRGLLGDDEDDNEEDDIMITEGSIVDIVSFSSIGPCSCFGFQVKVLQNHHYQRNALFYGSRSSYKGRNSSHEEKMIPVLSYYGNLCSIGRKNLATRRATVASCR